MSNWCSPELIQAWAFCGSHWVGGGFLCVHACALARTLGQDRRGLPPAAGAEPGPRAASPVSTKPTAGFLTAHRRARTPVRLQHQPPKTPENELSGRGRGGDGSWQRLGRFGPPPSAPFPGGTGLCLPSCARGGRRRRGLWGL